MAQLPAFPLYIPSKGRHEYMVTSKALSVMGVPHFIVVEPQEVEAYKASVKRFGLLATILELDMAFKAQYELCDRLGLTKSTGPGPARNFAWEHSKKNGHAWHWVMDDNIRHFYRFHKNRRIKMETPLFWTAMEDFCLRYTNIAMAGPNYLMFAVPGKRIIPPIVFNTRIYSCNLIRNDVPFRWRGRYNEDTIISIDMLKAGWCTVQFNAFLQAKMGTQMLKGGNTAEFYHAEGKVKQGAIYADGGTTKKSEMLVNVHPDCSRLVHKFNRVHHTVDYNRFKNNKLIKKQGLVIDKDAYKGIKLVAVKAK